MLEGLQSFGSAFLVIALVCFVIQIAVTQRVLHIDLMEVSGLAFEQGKLWRLVTASFTHANWAHLINNLIMFAAYSRPLEDLIGSMAVLACFIGIGALSWIASVLYTRIMFPKEWQCAGKFVSSCGSSPCTYGLCFLLMHLDPHAEIHWFRCFAVAVWVLPLIASQENRSKMKKLFLLGAVLSVLFGVNSLYLQFEFSPAFWMTVYSLKIVSLLVLDALWIKKLRVNCADDTSHLAGSALGVSFAYCFNASSFQITTSSLEAVCWVILVGRQGLGYLLSL
jgi:membrane associated rhomboid family serine protease